MKQCKKCKQILNYTFFHKDNKSKDGYKNVCKDCRSISKRKKLLDARKRFDRNLKHNIYIAIKKNKDGLKWEETLEFTLQELKKHLESQFDNNMKWDNYGSYWWIDKIIPTRAYNYGTPGEFKKCWSLKNLRPLQKKYCVIKSDKIFLNLVEEYKLFDIMPIGKIEYTEERFEY